MIFKTNETDTSF